MTHSTLNHSTPKLTHNEELNVLAYLVKVNLNFGFTAVSIAVVPVVATVAVEPWAVLSNT